MKKITVAVKDSTQAQLVEQVELHHLSDLGEGVKEVVDEFAAKNAGVVLPPLTIQAVEKKDEQDSEKRS